MSLLSCHSLRFTLQLDNYEVIIILPVRYQVDQSHDCGDYIAKVTVP